MKARIRLARFFTYIVAFQLLNLSIYNAEFEIPQASKSLANTVDETDSFIEFIAENIFHIKDIQTKSAHKNSSKQSHLHKSFQAKLFWCTSDIYTFNAPKIVVHSPISLSINYSYLFYKEINPPPPKNLS